MKTIYAIIFLLIAQTAIAGPAEEAATAFNNGRKVVIKTLLDPDSVRFRNEFIVRNPKNNMYWMCGEVNAKNRFGGYAGFTRYVTAEDWSYVDSDGNESSEEMINNLCIKAAKLYGKIKIPR